jgi:glycosyltransferase involved in cell wall biosynthesis
MAPQVSIGLPVRNGEQFIGKAIESVLAQDYSDLELVICDNASDDSTPDIVRSYVVRDPRVKLHQNESDLGQIENMNRVFELASGAYFRWIGADDWFEPNYISTCTAHLDRHPKLIGVSTYIKYFDDDGNSFYYEYTGERLESPHAHRRFSRMLWLLSSDYRYCDPHYTMYRRTALEKTHLCQVAFAPDRILAAEVSLVGPIGHIPECLAYRRRVPSDYSQRDFLHRRYRPDEPDKLRRSWGRLSANFNRLVSAAPLTGYQKAVCRAAIARFFFKTERRALKRRARHVIRGVPGMRKAKAALGR